MSIKKTEGENQKKGLFSRLFSHSSEQVKYDEYEEIFMNSAENNEEQASETEEKVEFSSESVTDEAESNTYQCELEFQSDKEQEVLVAEKEEIEISAESDTVNKMDSDIEETVCANDDASPMDSNSTAVFTFAKEPLSGAEVEQDELSVSELQDSAKTFFNETHSDSIDDKVEELCKLANSGFDTTEESTEHTDLGLELAADEEDSEKKKKKKKKDVVSNDDIEMLSTIAEDENEATPSLLEGMGNTELLGKKYAELLDDNNPDVEYTDKAQEKSILSSLRKNAIFSFFGMLLSLAAFIACLYFETSAGTSKWHPAFFEPGRYGLVYALSMLQILFISVMLNLDGVIRGFKSLSKAKSRPEAIAVVTTLVCTFHVIAGITFAYDSAQMRTYCSVGCFTLLLLAVNSFIKAYTALSSFCIAASKMPKYTTDQLDAASTEASAFAKYLEEDTTIFTVDKCNFVSGFFKKCFARPESSKRSFNIYIVGISAGFVSAIISAIISKNAYTAITTGCAVSLAALPANILLSTALPFFIASLKSARTKTAFIGEAACDMYTQAGILSFDDSEVFPSKGVKVSSIRTYGDTRIDKVIIFMARIFNKLDGPLSYIFDRSVQDSNTSIGEAEIISISPDGIKAKIDGDEIYVGTSKFLRLYDVHTPTDEIDEAFLQSLGSIIYMATGSSLSAKFYIKYSMNQGFEPLLRSLYDSGICAGVKTIDPSINNQLIGGNLRGTGYPVSVIKRDSVGTEQQSVREELAGSVISLTGTHNFLKGFIRLDGLRNTYRSNILISIISSIVGIIITSIATLLGFATILPCSFFIIFAMLWCVPTAIMSLLIK